MIEKAVGDPQGSEDTVEMFPMQVASVGLDNSQFVTLCLNSGNYLRFQVDTGAQCSVVPLTVYKKATGDVP